MVILTVEQITLDGQWVRLEMLETTLRELMQNSEKPDELRLLIKADAALAIDTLNEVLQRIKRTGLNKLTLATQKRMGI
jgi:biopolymer transport protein ExbD